jgi:prefoldin subunit 5
MSELERRVQELENENRWLNQQLKRLESAVAEIASMQRACTEAVLTLPAGLPVGQQDRRNNLVRSGAGL